MNETTPQTAPTDGPSAAPVGNQQTNVTPPPPPPPAKSMDKMGWIVAAVLFILLLIGFIWWWMMYGQGTNNSTTPSSTEQSSDSSNGSDGSDGTDGSDGSDGSSGSEGSSSAIDGLSVSVQNGQSKATVESSAGGLEPNCVSVDTGDTTASQEVCTYQEGTKSVKVTYQDDQVVDVTRTGF